MHQRLTHISCFASGPRSHVVGLSGSLPSPGLSASAADMFFLLPPRDRVSISRRLSPHAQEVYTAGHQIVVKKEKGRAVGFRRRGRNDRPTQVGDPVEKKSYPFQLCRGSPCVAGERLSVIMVDIQICRYDVDDPLEPKIAVMAPVAARGLRRMIRVAQRKERSRRS